MKDAYDGGRRGVLMGVTTTDPAVGFAVNIVRIPAAAGAGAAAAAAAGLAGVLGSDFSLKRFIILLMQFDWGCQGQGSRAGRGLICWEGNEKIRLYFSHSMKIQQFLAKYQCASDLKTVRTPGNPGGPEY